ncbi:26435_t:CDS:2, partial [Gigaspora margarita]
EKKKLNAKARGDYLPTDKEIDEIIESCVPKNTCKAMKKWVKALTRWRNNVGYCYSIETVANGSDYSPSSLVNAYNCLSNYIYKHPGGSKKFIINNKSEFLLLWEALNGKMKVLKQSGKVTKHHDLLSPDELKAMFNHDALSVNTANCIQFTKFSQKNDPGGIEGNLDSLMIPVPPDPEGYLGPIHDIKLYLNRRPTNCACQFLHLKINKDIHEYEDGKWYLDAKLGQNSCSNFMKNICSEVEINIKDHDIVNHSGRTTPIIPSEQQKMDALSTLINVVDLPESQNNEDDGIINSDKIYDPKPDNRPNSHIPPKRSVYSEFRSTLKDSAKVNLPSHSNATKKNPSLGEKRLIRPSHSKLQNVSTNEGTTIINNYYLDAEHITINQY